MADLPEVFQPQTLRQFVASYNEVAISHLASPATTRVDHTTGTKGALTDPERRLAPEHIEPWTDLDREQERGIISTLLREVDGIGADNIAFPARYHVDRVGEDLGRLDSETAVLYFDNDTLHKPASRLLRALLANDRVRKALERRQQYQQQQQHQQQRIDVQGDPSSSAYRPGGIGFTTHLNRLPQSAGRKRKRDAAIIAPMLGPADVFCIFEPERSAPSENIIVASGTSMRSNVPELLFLKEAKASHKLTDNIIDQAVTGEKILEPRVIMGRGVGDSYDTHDCEYWFAAVCAQIYTSMIDKGLRYGIISTGARYIFVTINPEDLSTLRYSLCRASVDIVASPLLRTVSLALLALQHGPLPTSHRLNSLRDGGGLIWTTATASFTTANSSDSHARAETESWEGSPAQTNDRSPSRSDQPGDQGTSPVSNQASIFPPLLSAEQSIGQHPVKGCTSSMDTLDRCENSTTGCVIPPSPRPAASEVRGRVSPYPSPPPQSESRPGKRSRQNNGLETTVSHMSAQPAKRAKTDDDVGPATSAPPPLSPTSPSRSSLPVQYVRLRDRHFCTQTCIQSLMSGPDQQRPPADTTCPNHADHQHDIGLTGTQLCQRLRAQLTMRISDAPPYFSLGYEFLNFTSGHTQIMKLRLGSSGHVLLAKAFMPSDLGVMRREARFYAHLRHLQGDCVPICVGTIEMPADQALPYDGFRFTGLLLLGWAGMGPDQWNYVGGGLGHGGEADRAFVRALAVEARRALMKIHEAGVLHRDVALRNVLVRDFALEGRPSCPRWRLRVSIIDFELSRNRAMYGHYETRRLRGRPHTRDLNREFAEAQAKEMDTCADVIRKWCPDTR